MARLLLYALLLGFTCSGSGACSCETDGGCAPDFDVEGCGVGEGDDAGIDAGAAGQAASARCEALSAAQPMLAPAELSLTLQTPSPLTWENGMRWDVYAGALRVGEMRDDALELSGERVSALWRGAHPALPQGTLLWATFDQRSVLPNPFAAASTRSNQLRTGEYGAFLIDDQLLEVPVGLELTFLGARTSVEVLCTIDRSCRFEAYYLVTIHGRTDLSLAAGEHGRVVVGEEQYEVTVVQAVSIEYARRSCAPADWVRTPPLHLVGHAVAYQVPPPRIDAGMSSDVDAGHDMDAGRDADAGHEQGSTRDAAR